MRTIASACIAAACSLAALTAQGDPQPTCRMCPASYIADDEIQAYVKKAIAEKLTDQQIRDVEIGKSHVGIGVVHRGKLAAPAPESRIDSQRRDARAQGGRRHCDSSGHGSLVHEDRRSHHVSDDSSGPRQGHAAPGRDGVARVSSEAGAPTLEEFVRGIDTEEAENLCVSVADLASVSSCLLCALSSSVAAPVQLAPHIFALDIFLTGSRIVPVHIGGSVTDCR